jgi:hypothetical protein
MSNPNAAALLLQQQQQLAYAQQLYYSNPQLYAYWLQQQQQQQQPLPSAQAQTVTGSANVHGVPGAAQPAQQPVYTPEQLAYYQQYQQQYAAQFAQMQLYSQQMGAVVSAAIGAPSTDSAATAGAVGVVAPVTTKTTAAAAAAKAAPIGIVMAGGQVQVPGAPGGDDDNSKDGELKPPEPQENFMELWRSQETMNLPEAVYKNVRISGFYVQELRLLQRYDDVVNIAKKSIKYCEPWIGQSRNPSALWCVLWKCFKLRLTRRQVEALLRSQQSPYLRVLGLLYVRFAALPEVQWELYDALLHDNEEVVLTAVTRLRCTVGQFTHDLIVKSKIFDIIMPRIPVPIHKRWLEELNAAGSFRARHGGGGDDEASGSHERSPPPRSRARSRSPVRY